MKQLRIEAAQQGQTIYTGNPCSVCGNQKRYVSSNACIECQKGYTRKYRNQIKEAMRLAQEGGQQ